MRLIPLLFACALLCACTSAPPAAPSAPSPNEADRPHPALFLSVAEDLALGHPAARVALVVISDFQCPYCRRLHREVLPAVKARYIDTGLVRLYHKDFPLPMHRQAFAAALAARCAAHQGQLGPMQDKLYAAPALSPAVLHPVAETLDLDRARFEACMQNPSTRAVVDRGWTPCGSASTRRRRWCSAISSTARSGWSGSRVVSHPSRPLSRKSGRCLDDDWLCGSLAV